MLVYKNMLLPMLEYGDVFLSASSIADRKKLQVLQNKGLRCALNRDKFASMTELHEDVDLLKLTFRREQHLLNYMFDVSKVESNLKDNKEVGVRTRSSKKKLLKTIKPRTEKFKKSFSYMGPKNGTLSLWIFMTWVQKGSSRQGCRTILGEKRRSHRT